MNPHIIYICISIGSIFILCSLWYLYKDIARVHKDLRALRVRAVNAENEAEFEDIKVSLLLYASKNCWHQHLTSSARDVLNYINGRLRNYGQMT